MQQNVQEVSIILLAKISAISAIVSALLAILVQQIAQVVPVSEELDTSYKEIHAQTSVLVTNLATWQILSALHAL